MKNKKVLQVLTLLIVLIFSSTALAAIRAEVVIGKEVILTLTKPSSRTSIANLDIADIKGICGYTKKGDYQCKQIMKEKPDIANIISIKEIVLIGKQLGTTSLIVWDTEGKPTFFDVFVIPNLSALEEHIKEMPGTDDIIVTYANDYIVLSGTALNEDTIKKAESLANTYAKDGIPTITTRYSAGVTEAIKTPSVRVLNFISIKDAQQVLLQVKVAQIDKTKLKELGLSFLVKGEDGEFTTPGFVASPGGTLGGAAGVDVTPGITGFDLTTQVPQIGVAHFPSGVAAFIKALSSNNLAKILAEPNMVVRSGEKGKFHVGTKVPIQTVYGVGEAASVSITFEEVGIRLNFAPEVLETGVIRLKIDPAEVSNITDYLRYENIIAPIIDTRKVETSVDLKEGESLILAGLLSEETKKGIQKIPILGDIPILGAIFRSTSDELAEKELAFFITPKLVKPTPSGEKTKLPTDGRPTPEEEKEFRWLPLPEERPGDLSGGKCD